MKLDAFRCLCGEDNNPSRFNTVMELEHALVNQQSAVQETAIDKTAAVDFYLLPAKNLVGYVYEQHGFSVERNNHAVYRPTGASDPASLTASPSPEFPFHRIENASLVPAPLGRHKEFRRRISGETLHSH